MREVLSWTALSDPQIRALVEPLRRETRRLFLVLTVGLYAAWHTVGILVAPDAAALAYWGLLPAVAGGLTLSAWLDRRDSPLATPALLATGVGTTLAAILLFQSPTPAVVLPTLTFAAVALLNPLAGLSVATVSGALLVWLASTGQAPALSPHALLQTVVASLLAVVAAWALGRNMIVAAGWALTSYEHAQRRTDEAERHRAELVQALKQRDDAYWRLEQLNLELERTRRAAHEARRLKEQFAVAVSHELRTPLNLILGFCEMMVMAPSTAYGQRLPATYRGDLEAMYRNASHLSELVDDILDLSQIDADRMALHRDWAAPADLVGEAMATVETMYVNRDLYLEASLPPDLPALFVDRTRIRQILINLLSNAVRFVQEGGVSIEARTEGQMLVILVRDTGPGITPQDLPYVFDEFRQSSDPARRRGGTGLGLAVSRRFAQLHGGELSAESAESGGAVFTLRLPLSPEAPTTNPHVPPWEGPVASRVRGEARRRIVVVDERGEVTSVFRRYFDDYDVLHIGELERSLRQQKLEPVQAVVFGTAEAPTRWRAVSAAAPHLADLPEISCVLRTVRSTAEEIGADDYLLKPVTRDQLRAALRRIGRTVSSVLIVDDDPGMTRLLARMVRATVHGAAVTVAHDGATALRLARERPPDAILLDLLMPGVDGYEVLQAIRADASLRAIPTLVVSARGLHDESVIATSLGIGRDRGLTVGEAMRCVRAGLGALLAPGTSASAPSEAPPP